MAKQHRSQYNLFKQQVSGKAPKLIANDNKTILKCHIDLQQQFYNYFSSHPLTHPCCLLIPFLPLYFGTVTLPSKPIIQYNPNGENKQISIWLQHVKLRYDRKNEGNKFISMYNFLYSYNKSNILDIKIGGRQEKPKKITKSIEQYKMKLNGMLKTDLHGQTQFISKYHLNEVNEFQLIKKYIAYFFTTDKQLQTVVLSRIVDKLSDLVLALRATRGWKFVSTSICLIFDASNLNKVDVKYIDFGRAQNFELCQNYDEDTSAGVEYVIKMIKQIIGNPEKYENTHIEINQKQEVVPLAKVKKFQSFTDSFQVSPSKLSDDNY